MAARKSLKSRWKESRQKAREHKALRANVNAEPVTVEFARTLRSAHINGPRGKWVPNKNYSPERSRKVSAEIRLFDNRPPSQQPSPLRVHGNPRFFAERYGIDPAKMHGVVVPATVREAGPQKVFRLSDLEPGTVARVSEKQPRRGTQGNPGIKGRYAPPTLTMTAHTKADGSGELRVHEFEGRKTYRHAVTYQFGKDGKITGHTEHE